MHFYYQQDKNTGTYNVEFFEERNLKTNKHFYIYWVVITPLCFFFYIVLLFLNDLCGILIL